MARAATIDDPAAVRLERLHRLVAPQVDQALRAEELAGLELATRGLLLALVLTAGWLFVWVGAEPRLFFLESMLVLFALVALVNRRVSARRHPPPWWPYAVVGTHFALLAFSMVGFDLLVGADEPAQMMLRNGTFVYFFLFLAAVAQTYAPRLVLFAGVVGALAWQVAVHLIARLPSTTTPGDHPADLSVDQYLALHLDPRFVDTDVITQDAMVLLLVAGILAGGVWRARRLVLRQAVAARERANLARYFAPTIVDRLAQADEPLGAVRAQPVAVLFADIVGFTEAAETESPVPVIALLREFHARLEAAIFEHGGTLDKYLGDGVMATFGTPEVGPQDGANALASARAMLAAIEHWNGERAARGQAPIRLSIGIHHGEVVLGDIGTARRLEFAVIGDVVNVASRLEKLTRRLGTSLVVSDGLIEAIEAGDPAGAKRTTILAGLERAAPQTLPGRTTPVPVWTLASA
jgi:adenylate cyclase